MDAERLQRVQSLFHAAADLALTEQRTFLQAACGEDTALMADVLLMLDEDRREGSLLDGDVAQIASQLLDEASLPFHRVREFGPYRLQRVLGEGGMGVVYLAERDDLGNLVAIKFLRDAWLSPARRERFASEQRTLSHLTHPSIARLYDAGVLTEGTPWFVMEYVDGIPVTEYCRQHNCSLAMRLQLFRSICEAVQYAHEHAVIHRNLKPSNILVKNDAGVRLLDFGIAKHLESLDQPVDQTRTELRLMTPAYAAPEQVRGEAVGIFTDVYALGLILYELLTDRQPFNLSKRPPGEAEKIIIEDDPEKPSAAAARIKGAFPPPRLVAKKGAWADLDVLCLTAVQKDPRRRYRSVEALVRDVDHHLNGEPLEARPDSMSYRVGKFIGRNRRAASIAAITFTAVICLVVFFTLRLAHAQNAALAAAARTQRVQRFMLNLFEGGDKSAAPAESLRVITLADRGLQEAKTLTRNPELRAELYQTLGGIYQKLGKFDRAESLLREALEERKSSFGPNHAEVAESLVALGLLHLDQARFEEAERLIRDGLDKLRRVQPPDNEAIARATLALGKVLEARGAYTAAIPVLDQAARLQSDSKSPGPELASTLKELADTHFYSGHYDICETLTRRALAMHRQLFGERHPAIADDLINLGAVQIERGHYPEAEEFYRQALAINQGWYGNNHPETASNLYMLGEALVSQKRFDEAQIPLEQALAIQERVYGPMHPHVANVLNELCIVASQREQLDKAEACYSRVSQIYKIAYGDHHYLVALGLANLASIYVDKKEYARAEQVFRDVIKRYGEALPADHLYVGIAQIKLGRTLVRQKRYAEAEEHTLSGYKILNKQTSPSVSWLQSARKDLVTIYEGLNERDKAAPFRAELAKLDSKTPLTKPK